MFTALGAEVVLLVSRQQVLPGKDPEVAAALEDDFLRRGVVLLKGARADGAERTGNGVRVVRMERNGGPAAAYPDFARGYGADLRESPLAQELAAVRLLAATLHTIAMAADDSRYAGEANARVRYWTGDPAAPIWTAL
jgi:hypothetical protein